MFHLAGFQLQTPPPPPSPATRRIKIVIFIPLLFHLAKFVSQLLVGLAQVQKFPLGLKYMDSNYWFLSAKASPNTWCSSLANASALL